MRPVVNSAKHYTHLSLATVLAGALSVEEVVTGVPVKDVNLGREVREGAVVKAVFIERWVRTNDTSPGSFIFCVIKLPSGLANPTTTEMANLHAYDNKKNVLYTCQGLSNDQNANAIPCARGWFKIPKGKQRIGLGDRIITVLFAQALDQNWCGFTTYKEYF